MKQLIQGWEFPTELGDNLAWYRGLIENLNVGIVVHASDTRILTFNKLALELLGVSKEQMIGKKAMDPQWKFVDENHLPLSIEEYPVNRIRQSKNKLNKQILGVLHPSSNKLVWLSVTGFPVIDEKNSMSEIVISFIDITDKINSDKLLNVSNKLYKSILKNSPDAMALCSLDGIVEDISDIAVTMFSYDEKSEIIGRNMMEFIHPNDVPRAQENFQKMFQGILDGPEPYIGIGKKNKEFPMEVNGDFVKDDTGNLNHILFIIRDLTERYRIEKTLRESEEKYSKVFHTSPYAITLNEVKTGNFIDANNAFYQISGYSKEEIKAHPEIGKSIWVDDNERLEVMELLKAGKTVFGKEYKFYTKNGDILIGLFSAQVILINNVPVGFSSINDITIQKQVSNELEAKNEELKKLNEEKNSYFSILSHDLRGPINGFVSLSELMVEEAETLNDPAILKMAQIMKKSASNLSLLLDNLLQWAKIQRGLVPMQIQKVSVAKIYHDCLDSVLQSIHQKKISLIKNFDENETIEIDPNIICTIIRNLISNSIKFTKQGGEIHFNLRKQANNEIEISIEDNGIGMNQKILDNLFVINHQKNRKGTDGEPSTGMGLVICKELIEKHGGKLTVESEENKGSKFTLILPSNTDE
jgi:PAS domain S-box-containing protein